MKPWGRVVLNVSPTPGPPAGAEVAEDLLAAWRRAAGAVTGADGHVAYERLPGLPEVAAAVARARDLGRVDLPRLGGRPGRLAFWLNVYNALAIHGIVALGVRHSVLRVWNVSGG